MTATKKCFSGTKTSFGSIETYLESLLKVLGRKSYLLCVYLDFYLTSEISLVFSA